MSQYIKLHGCAHDLTGRQFGRLVPLGPIERIYREPRGTEVIWLCHCECGELTRVRAQWLRTGNTKSCGCLNQEKLRSRLLAQVTHGASGTPEFWIWSAAKGRCHNENDKRYHQYGGRGIKMCERWRDSFANFIADMGLKPTPDHSLDREDNDGDYEPGNCRWATGIDQANNTRRNLFIEAFGKRQTLSQWARELGMRPATIWHRIFRNNWDVERALTQKPRGNGPR